MVEKFFKSAIGVVFNNYKNYISVKKKLQKFPPNDFSQNSALTDFW